MSVFDVLKPEYRGKSRSDPFRPEAFPGRVLPNRIPKTHESFVSQEVTSLVENGCLVKGEDARGPRGPVRPRMALSISVEPQKPRVIIKGIPLNDCHHEPFSMDTACQKWRSSRKNGYSWQAWTIDPGSQELLAFRCVLQWDRYRMHYTPVRLERESGVLLHT